MVLFWEDKEEDIISLWDSDGQRYSQRRKSFT